MKKFRNYDAYLEEQDKVDELISHDEGLFERNM